VNDGISPRGFVGRRQGGSGGGVGISTYGAASGGAVVIGLCCGAVAGAMLDMSRWEAVSAGAAARVADTFGVRWESAAVGGCGGSRPGAAGGC